MATHTRQRWPQGQRVAILNWRDADHPQAGGAEIYCTAVAQWLVSQGAEVTLVTSRASGQARRSVKDGVAIHRGGGRFGVYLYVLAWLLARRPIRLLRRRGRIDMVLDCQNGIPFFSPLAVGRRVPVALLIHHVHQEQFDLHFGKHLACIGRFLEGPASRRIYAGHPVLAVSPSTRHEIRRHLRFRNPIYVVPNGGPRPKFGTHNASAHPSVVTVGRLVVQKHVDHLLVALAEARTEIPDLVLNVIGDGPEMGNLQRLAAELSLEDAVVFHGRVNDAERDRILAQSWLFLSASQREGWGVAVLEAASHGVPALVRDVPGLRDAVRDEVTGWLLREDWSFSDSLVAAIDLLAEEGESEAMAERCFAWAQNFSWARSARRVSEILEHEYFRISGNQPMRTAPDLVTRVELELGPDSEARVGSLLRSSRLTDEWRWAPGRLVGLLYGTDEKGAQRALTRLGVGSEASLEIARSHDLLGDVPMPVPPGDLDLDPELESDHFAQVIAFPPVGAVMATVHPVWDESSSTPAIGAHPATATEGR